MEVKSSIDKLWHIIFDKIPTDVISAELKRFEDEIMRLHEKSGSTEKRTCVVYEEEWIIDSQDLLYMQYVTPFHIAAWLGNYEFFTLMRTKFPFVWNQYISAVDLLGNLPVHVAYFACDHWSHDIVGLRCSADPQSSLPCLHQIMDTDFQSANALGLSSLHIACLCDQQSGVRQLLQQHIVIDYPVHFPYENICTLRSSIDQIRDVTQCIPTNCHHNAPLHCSCYQECGSLDSLLGSTFSDDYFDESHCCSYERCMPMACDSPQRYRLAGLTALHLSLLADAPRCALLVLRSIDSLVSTSDGTPSPLQLTTLYSLAIFSFFSTAARQQCFRKLPKTLSNPTEDLIPNTLVNGLITTNYASVISILSSQINLNSPCFAHYFSPLHIACVLLNETFVRLLLGYGANCRARTPAGDTCLHIVVKTQAHAASPQLRSRLCGLLLMAGCDPLALDARGFSPLWYVVR